MHIALLGTSAPALPAIFVGLASCSLAAYTDLRERKVPNWLTLSTLAIALGTVSLRGLAAFEAAIVVLVVALVLGAALQSTGILGGGDVKLLIAICVLVGFPNCLALLLYTALAGGALAIVSSGLQRRLRSLVKTTVDIVVTAWITKSFVGRRAGNPSRLADRLPYALAIAAGFALLVLSNTYVPALRLL